MIGYGIFLSSFLLLSAPAGSQEDLESRSAKTWLNRYEELEELLKTAEVVSVEDVGMGVMKPRRATFKSGDQTFDAAYKPIKRGRHKGYWESYEAEVAAYGMDRLLGLDMVPPTVVRRVESDLGSLQLWIDNTKLYADVQDKTPRSVRWTWQLSRMKMFDVLINNTDRNAQNFLVDPDFNIVLIDHSRAFTSGTKILDEKDKLPTFFDRKLVERLKALTREELDGRFKDLLMGGQIEGILKRRDGLLEHLEKLIAERGETQVLF
jgi:hypothetical protein